MTEEALGAMVELELGTHHVSVECFNMLTRFPIYTYLQKYSQMCCVMAVAKTLRLEENSVRGYLTMF